MKVETARFRRDAGREHTSGRSSTKIVAPPRAGAAESPSMPRSFRNMQEREASNLGAKGRAMVSWWMRLCGKANDRSDWNMGLNLLCRRRGKVNFSDASRCEDHSETR